MSPDEKSMLVFWSAVAVVAVIAYLVHRAYERRRTREWQAFAASLGCAFSEKDPFGMLRTCDHPVFQQGHSRRVTNVLHGHYRDRPIRCFDYRYTVGGGKNSHTYYLTLLLAQAPVPFEAMVVRPEHFGDALAAMVGFDDIDFESDEFSRRFHVTCSDRRFAYDVLHQRAMEFLLQHPDLTIQTTSVSMVFLLAGAGRLQIPAQVRGLLDLGCDFMDLLPEHLLRERAAVAEAGTSTAPSE
jgi:hypothetical protein